MQLSTSIATPLDPTTSTDSEETITVLVSDDDAANFLPALPPLKSSIDADPKDEPKLKARLATAQNEAYILLMGNNMNDRRTCPMADWCIESYTAKPSQRGLASAGNGVVMYRVFGMVSK
jgi:hypothetical protein